MNGSLFSQTHFVCVVDYGSAWKSNILIPEVVAAKFVVEESSVQDVKPE